MSPRVGSEAESGTAAVARNTDREETRPKLTVWPGTAPQIKAPTPVDRIGKLTAAELAELSPPEARGVQSGAFSKRFGQESLDWSALRNPTPLPPPPAAEPILVPSAVQPFYGAPPGASERAELHISDLSLELANPFLGSSLTPPPPPKRPWLRPLLITLGGCLLIGSGYVGAVYHVERHAAATVAKWTGAEVAPAIAVVPDAPLGSAAPIAPVAEPSIAQPAVLEPMPADQPVAHATSEAAHTTTAVEEAVATATPESTAAAAIEQPTAVAAETPATESSAAAKSPRARRRAARAAARAAASAASAAQAAAKAVEPKPEIAPPAAPVAPAPARAALAPNPYVTRPAPVARVAPAPIASGPMPQTLSRTQVQSGLENVRGQLESCASGAHGRMTANVTISGAGRVTYATVEGAFAGTPQGSCMARALRGAQFPQFASPQLRVVYPFAL